LLLGGRYRLDDRLGAGGMGEVWRATDMLLRRPVAVKLLRPELARDEDGLARFRSEARSAASVPHPCVAQVYDYSEDAPGGQPYLVMELVDGTSLDRLVEDGPLGAAFTMDVVAQAAQGLAAAHAVGLVHRDIKPQNLLVTRDGQVKITDFGIASAAGSAMATSTGVLVCTPAYLAPERAAGAAATPAADLYALGIVAYQCLTGRLPFTGEPLAVMLAHRDGPLPPLPPSVPSEAAALVAALTAKDPRARPARAAEVAAQAIRLHAALTGPLAAKHGAKAQRPRRPVAVAGRAGLALAGIGVIGLGGWMVAHQPGPAAANQQLSGRPAATGQPGTHRHGRPARPHASPTAALSNDPTGPSPAAPTHRTPAAGPRHSHSPTPKGTPAPSPHSPSLSPSPSPPDTTPPPSPTPSPSASPTTPGPTPSGAQ
jgi:eukaryotic-like serine/threonine-protein kinase